MVILGRIGRLAACGHARVLVAMLVVTAAPVHAAQEPVGIQPAHSTSPVTVVGSPEPAMPVLRDASLRSTDWTVTSAEPLTAMREPLASPVRADGRTTGTYVLRGLYGSFAMLQVLDVVSTRRVLEQGGHEVNPLVKPFAGNTAALVTMKAAGTAATIVLTNRLARKNRIGAIVTAAALNSLYVAVVSNNFAVARNGVRR